MTRRGREWHILATLDYPFLSSIFGFYPSFSLFPFPFGRTRCIWQDERAERRKAKTNERTAGARTQDSSPRWSTDQATCCTRSTWHLHHLHMSMANPTHSTVHIHIHIRIHFFHSFHISLQLQLIRCTERTRPEARGAWCLIYAIILGRFMQILCLIFK